MSRVEGFELDGFRWVRVGRLYRMGRWRTTRYAYELAKRRLARSLKRGDAQRGKSLGVSKG